MNAFEKIQNAIEVIKQASASEDSAIKIKKIFGSGAEIRISIRPSGKDLELEALGPEELNAFLDALEQKLESLQAEEPEDEHSAEYEKWEERIEDLEDQIEEVESAIGNLEDATEDDFENDPEEGWED